MNSSLTQEQKDLIEILKLLEETFKGKDTKKIEEAEKKLKEEFKDELYTIPLLIQALSIKSIEKKNITLDLHKSVVVYLKKIFFNMNKNIPSELLFSYLVKILELIINHSKENPDIINIQIFNYLQKI